MQATYYKYFLVDKKTKKKVRTNVRPFLSNWCSWNIPQTKGEFTHNAERVYLINIFGDRFLFLHTLDHEIIKKIDSQTIAVEDLNKYLAGDSAGFASYMVIREDFFCIACRVLSPRAQVFCDYVNGVFEKLGFNLEFNAVALTHDSQKTAISGLSRVGKVSIKLERDNRLHEDIVEYLGGKAQTQYDQIGSIEIIVKPESRTGNIKNFLKSLSDNVGRKGVSEFEARVLTSLTDKVTDLYLVGEGVVRNPVQGNTDSKIFASVESGISSNRLLASKIAEYRNEDGISEGSIDRLDNAIQPAGWN